MFAPHQFGQIVLFDVGVLLWLGILAVWMYQSGFSQVFCLYLVPYLWLAILVILDFQHLLNTLNRVNHWLVLITFLQHTDPLLLHYHLEEFTFPYSTSIIF